MPHFEHEPVRVTNRPLFSTPDGAFAAEEVLTGDQYWERYAQAYKDAADALVQLAIDGRPQVNGGWTPILFLYWHYVELHLKSLLIDAGELLDDEQTVPRKHELKQLWEKRVRPLLLRVGDGSHDPWLARVQEVILSLDAVDPTSFAFRYPVDNDRQPSLSGEFLFDPATVRDVIAELHVWLGGTSAQISVYRSVDPT